MKAQGMHARRPPHHTPPRSFREPAELTWKVAFEPTQGVLITHLCNLEVLAVVDVVALAPALGDVEGKPDRITIAVTPSFVWAISKRSRARSHIGRGT